MNTILQYFLCALIGYIIGTSNMAYYLGKLKNTDLRKGGSGNLGTSNAVILLGAKAGIVVFLHDMLKAVIASIICRWLFPGAIYGPALASVMAVFGHMYPFYLKFKGGKGFATYIGMVAAIDWKFCLVMAVAIIVVSLIFDWIVAGTFVMIFAAPVYFFLSINWVVCTFALLATIVIFIKHVPNIKKKLAGQEIGIRAAFNKKHK